MPKVSDYSNKLRVRLGGCHLEQKNYCFTFDGQNQVRFIDLSKAFDTVNNDSGASVRAKRAQRSTIGNKI